MTVLAIAGVELRRFLRDKSNIFFTFIFPLMLVVVIGLQFGGGSAGGRVLLTDTGSILGRDLEEALTRAEVTVGTASAADASEALARGRADAGVLITDDAAAGYEAGESVTVQVIQSTTRSAQTTAIRVENVLWQISTERAQVVALEAVGAPQAADALSRADAAVPPLTVEVTDVDQISQAFDGVTGFDVGAASQVLLFVFMAALAGSGTLIDARRSGVIARTLAAPVRSSEVIAGQAFGRWMIAAFQGAYVMFGTSLIFGVSWGNIGASLSIVAVFALVAAGFAMVIGSLLDNESAASGLGVGVSLILAALGGCMLPQELFPETLQTISKFTPHGWGYLAFADVQRHKAGVGDILGQLGVLMGFAIVALLAGSLLLKRSLGRVI